MTAIRRKHFTWLPLAAAVVFAWAGAFLLRYDFHVPAPAYPLLLLGLLCAIVLKPPVFWAFGLHAGSWRRTSLFDLCRVGAACAAASVLASAAHAMLSAEAFPPSIYVLDGILCLLGIAGVQITPRIYHEILRSAATRKRAAKSILIYGAGAAGTQLAKEIRSNPACGATVVGFVDDDEAKRGETFAGIPVLASGREVAACAARLERRGRPITEIVIAMPSATGQQMRTAVANCRAAGIPARTLPSVNELLEGKVIRQVREVAPEDLLGREPVHIEEDEIAEVLAGRTVLVTGGCGSIGAEICRQVLRFHPRKLVILDQAESEMFMLALNLRNRRPGLDLVTEIGDVTSAERVDEVFRAHSPDIVFHAAAYKHVPLMEDHVVEAVLNNVIGTYNAAAAAHRHGAGRFVMISTDKAVNPTSVMGLTKRVAELLVSAMPLDGGARSTRFVSVRFGNVLGSSGSVAQVFRRQIAAGGPVTVTHPEMRRYFMSISEAVQLVLQASTMGTGSDVFVLDMGEPVLIADLARNMIRLAGLVPGEDIEIRYTGLRPGEKLFEELHLKDENHLPTRHHKISRFASREVHAPYLRAWLRELRILLADRRADALVEHMRLIVPEYQGTRRTADEMALSAS